MKTIALLLVLLTATASADQKSAERLFRAGEKAYKAQKFLSAAQNFEEAYKELAAPEIAFSAAQAYRRQYRVDPTHPEYVEAAVRYYNIYIKEQKGGTRVGDAADSLGEMLHELDRLGLTMKTKDKGEDKPTRLGVSIVFGDRQQASGMHEVEEDKDKGEGEKNVPVAKAWIDGQPVELDSFKDIAPGDHVARAEADGYQPVEQTAHLVAHDSRFAELTLQPMPAHVTVDTEAGANIAVDGRTIGKAPHVAIDMPGGSHIVTITRIGRQPVARELFVTRDQKLTVPVPLQATARRRAVPWVLGAGGVAVVATGVFLLGANHYDNMAVDRLTLLDRGDQDHAVLDDYNRFKNRRDVGLDLAYISAGTAAAIGLTAAWMYYFDSPSAEGVRVTPFASGTTSGAAISGRF